MTLQPKGYVKLSDKELSHVVQIRARLAVNLVVDANAGVGLCERKREKQVIGCRKLGDLLNIALHSTGQSAAKSKQA